MPQKAQTAKQKILYPTPLLPQPTDAPMHYLFPSLHLSASLWWAACYGETAVDLPTLHTLLIWLAEVRFHPLVLHLERGNRNGERAGALPARE